MKFTRNMRFNNPIEKPNNANFLKDHRTTISFSISSDVSTIAKKLLLDAYLNVRMSNVITKN